MRKSLMDSDPTRPGQAGDRPPPLVAPGTTVGEARALLARTHADALVVEDRGQPIGVVTAHALLGAAPARHAGTPVADVMDYEAVHLDPTAGERSTMRAYVRAAWDSLLRRRPYRNRPADSATESGPEEG
jgi:CBS domain-containing protein